MVARSIADFYFRPSALKVTRQTDGKVDIVGSFLLNRGDSQRMSRYAVQVGSKRYEGAFEGDGVPAGDEPGATDSLFRFPFRITVAPETPVTELRLEAWSDSRRLSFGRTYTLSVPPLTSNPGS
jgi:hypothetical protein